MFGCFTSNGQICSATSRVLVHENIADQFLERLVLETKRIHIGDPLAPENMDKTGMLGPLVSQDQLDKVLRYVELGKSEGGTLLAGGRRPPQHSTGYFIEPTIFRATSSLTIWKVSRANRSVVGGECLHHRKISIAHWIARLTPTTLNDD